MADRDVLDRIKALRTDTVTKLSTEDGYDVATCVLETLVALFRQKAELIANAKLKGGVGMARELTSAARLVAEVADEVTKARKTMTQPKREPVSGSPVLATAPQTRDLVRDAELSDGVPLAGHMQCAGHASAGWRAEELTGEEDGSHVWIGPATLDGSRRWLCHPKASAYADLEYPAPHGRDSLAEETAAPVVRKSRLREARDHEPAVPVNGTPVSWGQLGAAADPGMIPAHLSPSQLESLDKCPAQVRMGRYMGLEQIPSFSRIGGRALHACVETLERAGAAGSTSNAEITSLWNGMFNQEVNETAASSTVPMAEWHASQGGKEGYDWWRVQGEQMLKRYADWRANEASGWEVLRIDGEPVIEYEIMLNVPGVQVPVKVILDIAFVLPDGSIVIVDHKTGSRMKADTIQLGTQARALDQRLYPDGDRITTCFFDARKGFCSPRFDALRRHPVEELSMRYSAADVERTHGMAVPRPSDLCVACGVKWACPIMNAKRATS